MQSLHLYQGIEVNVFWLEQNLDYGTTYSLVSSAAQRNPTLLDDVS